MDTRLLKNVDGLEYINRLKHCLIQSVPTNISNFEKSDQTEFVILIKAFLSVVDGMQSKLFLRYQAKEKKRPDYRPFFLDPHKQRHMTKVDLMKAAIGVCEALTDELTTMHFLCLAAMQMPHSTSLVDSSGAAAISLGQVANADYKANELDNHSAEQDQFEGSDHSPLNESQSTPTVATDEKSATLSKLRNLARSSALIKINLFQQFIQALLACNQAIDKKGGKFGIILQEVETSANDLKEKALDFLDVISENLSASITETLCAEEAKIYSKTAQPGVDPAIAEIRKTTANPFAGLQRINHSNPNLLENVFKKLSLFRMYEFRVTQHILASNFNSKVSPVFDSETIKFFVKAELMRQFDDRVMLLEKHLFLDLRDNCTAETSPRAKEWYREALLIKSGSAFNKQMHGAFSPFIYVSAKSVKTYQDESCIEALKINLKEIVRMPNEKSESPRTTIINKMDEVTCHDENVKFMKAFAELNPHIRSHQITAYRQWHALISRQIANLALDFEHVDHMVEKFLAGKKEGFDPQSMIAKLISQTKAVLDDLNRFDTRPAVSETATPQSLAESIYNSGYETPKPTRTCLSL